MAKQQKRVIDAEEIRLFDQKGRVRILLGTGEPDGAPQISLLDENQLQRLALSIRRDGSPIISFLHPDGPTLIGIGAEADGRTGIEIRHRNGTPFMTIGIDVNNDCQIEVRDASGNLQWASD